MRWVAVVVVAVVVASTAWAQPSRLPNIGKIIEQSDEFKAVPAMRNGCVLRMCANGKLCCVTTSEVTLAAGESTTVADASVKSTSLVVCGCETPTGARGCNQQGAWLAWLRVKSVAAGTYTLNHAYAAGDEVVTCSIE